MLYVFCGNDVINVRQKAHQFIDSQIESGFVHEYIDSESYTEGILSDAAGATSLFGAKKLYVLDTPSNNTEFNDAVLEHLAACKESENLFVVIEDPLLAPAKKQYAKYAETVEETKGEREERFNTFALADALAKKDKKTLWLLLNDAMREKTSPEEIIGILWWQLKSLRLAALTKSASEAGMKDFPYSKAKRALTKFTPGEVERLSQSLLAIYHDGHLGKIELDLALEAWTLRL